MPPRGADDVDNPLVNGLQTCEHRGMDQEKKQPFENPTVDDESDMPSLQEERTIGRETEREITQMINGIEG